MEKTLPAKKNVEVLEKKTVEGFTVQIEKGKTKKSEDVIALALVFNRFGTRSGVEALKYNEKNIEQIKKTYDLVKDEDSIYKFLLLFQDRDY